MTKSVYDMTTDELRDRLGMIAALLGDGGKIINADRTKLLRKIIMPLDHIGQLSAPFLMEPGEADFGAIHAALDGD